MKKKYLIGMAMVLISLLFLSGCDGCTATNYIVDHPDDRRIARVNCKVKCENRFQEGRIPRTLRHNIADCDDHQCVCYCGCIL